MCAPVAATSAAISANSSALPAITVVLTCTRRPAAVRARIAATVAVKCPAMPRTSS